LQFLTEEKLLEKADIPFRKVIKLAWELAETENLEEASEEILVIENLIDGYHHPGGRILKKMLF